MFVEQMKNVLNEDYNTSINENGMIGYATQGSKLVDCNFAVSSMRNMTEQEIVDKFMGAYYENPMLAMKWLFYMSDVREGLGERRSFRLIMQYLAEQNEEVAKAVLELIPEYSRWDNLIILMDCNNANITDEVIDIIYFQLQEDIKNMKAGKPISLLSKWMPSINCSNKDNIRRGKNLAKALGYTPKQYRQTLSELRKYLDVVERKMSAKEWDKINYSTVPSKANVKYSNAFIRNDKERRTEYLESLKKGETKINAGVLFPHDIVNKYTCYGDSVKSYDEALEQMWKALPNLSVENTLVIRDGSASMTWGSIANNSKCTPLDVATALAIYMSEHNTGEWKDKFITFSHNPKFVDLSNCNTLREKLSMTYREDDCSNTDIYKVMKLILDTAVRNNLSQNDMPTSIVILSDMQFDGRSHNLNTKLFNDISDEFKAHDLLIPRIIFWNLNNRENQTIPMRENELGLILCSGFSIQLLNMFMSNNINPYDILVETLNGVRYSPIETALLGIL